MGPVLGVGIIGAGHILKRHADACRALPGHCRLVAIADLDRDRALAAQRTFGFAAALTDHRELLDRKDVDVVCVCTPAGTHAALALDTIEAGKHVLIEKPLATTLEDADRLIRAASRHSGRTHGCVFQLRLDPVYRRLRWIIEQGEIGRVLSATARVRLRKSPTYFTSAPGRGSFRTDGGGVVINQAIHQLDAMLFTLGDVVEVSAVAKTLVHPIEGEDVLLGWVRFAGGAVGNVDCSTFAKRREFILEVIGENAAVRVYGDPDAQAFEWVIDAPGSAARDAIRSRAVAAVPEVKKAPKWARSLKKLAAKVTRQPALAPPEGGHRALLRAFLEAAATGSPAPVTLEEGRRSLALVLTLYESARTQRVLPLPDVSESAARQISTTGSAASATMAR